MFNPGDTVTSHEGWQLTIDDVKEQNGLLTYTGTRLDTGETDVALREVLLDSKLVFSKPQDRLFAGQIDRMDRFSLRYRARKYQSEQYRMPWSGLRGQRTSLIPHQLHIAHDVGRRHAPRVLLANSNLVPKWADWEHFNELDRKGLFMYGQSACWWWCRKPCNTSGW